MKPTIFVKSVTSALLDKAGLVARRLERLTGDKLLILMYHRVVEEQSVPGIQAGMFVEPSTFDMHLQYLATQFDVVPLSEWKEGGKARGGKQKQKPRCVLTFDDGWSDFYEFAFPILKRWELPATVFLPTGFVGTDRSFWTDRLAGAIRDEGQLRQRSWNSVDGAVDPIVGKILMLQGDYEHRLERAISLLKEERTEVIERVVDALYEQVRVDAAPGGRSFVDWNEVDCMRNSGLISFGSHTENHPILTTLNEAEVRREIRTSFDTLVARNASPREFLAFCYPNGNYTTRIAEIVREEGGHVAVTTEHGWAELVGNPYSLSRVGVHQDISSSRAMFAARIGGFF